MDRTLQPLALVLGIAAIIALRLVSNTDPLAGLIERLSRGDTPSVSQTSPEAEALAAQIEQLKAELDFKNSSGLNLVGANILNKTTASFRHIIKIDRGRQDGLKPDQPVIAKGLLLGIVYEVSEASATVLLLGDPELNVPVTTSGKDGIAGAKAGGLVVRELNDNNLAQSGQLVSTSGLGGLYPPGLAVGRLGARLSDDVLGEFVLERPIEVSNLSFVQVMSL